MKMDNCKYVEMCKSYSRTKANLGLVGTNEIYMCAFVI